MNRNSTDAEATGGAKIFELFEKRHEELGDVLHNGLCQSLGSAIFTTSIFQAEAGPAAEQFRQISDLLRVALEDVYRFARRLHPPLDGSFVEVLRELTLSTSPKCSFESEDLNLEVSPTTRLAIFRFVEFVVLEAEFSGVDAIHVALVKQASMGILSLRFQRQNASDVWGDRRAWEIVVGIAGGKLWWENSGSHETLFCSFPIDVSNAG